MKKQILNLGKTLNKAEQKKVCGGRPSLGCYGLYFCKYDCSEGDTCAVPNGLGGTLYGTIQNGLCCV